MGESARPLGLHVLLAADGPLDELKLARAEARGPTARAEHLFGNDERLAGSEQRLGGAAVAEELGVGVRCLGQLQLLVVSEEAPLVALGVLQTVGLSALGVLEDSSVAEHADS